MALHLRWIPPALVAATLLTALSPLAALGKDDDLPTMESPVFVVTCDTCKPASDSTDDENRRLLMYLLFGGGRGAPPLEDDERSGPGADRDVDEPETEEETEELPPNLPANAVSCGPNGEMWVPGTGCHPDSTCFQDLDNWDNATRMREAANQCLYNKGTWRMITFNGLPHSMSCDVGGVVDQQSLPTTPECFVDRFGAYTSGPTLPPVTISLEPIEVEDDGAEPDLVGGANWRLENADESP